MDTNLYSIARHSDVTVMAHCNENKDGGTIYYTGMQKSGMAIKINYATPRFLA